MFPISLFFFFFCLFLYRFARVPGSTPSINARIIGVAPQTVVSIAIARERERNRNRNKNKRRGRVGRRLVEEERKSRTKRNKIGGRWYAAVQFFIRVFELFIYYFFSFFLFLSFFLYFFIFFFLSFFLLFFLPFSLPFSLPFFLSLCIQKSRTNQLCSLVITLAPLFQPFLCSPMNSSFLSLILAFPFVSFSTSSFSRFRFFSVSLW